MQALLQHIDAGRDVGGDDRHHLLHRFPVGHRRQGSRAAHSYGIILMSCVPRRIQCIASSSSPCQTHLLGGDGGAGDAGGSGG